MKKMVKMMICFILSLSLTGCTQPKEMAIKEFETIGRWGNLALNISYKIPVSLQESFIRGSNSFTYLNGHMFSYLSNWKIYVETLLNGEADLYNLPLQISEEKQSDKYKKINNEIMTRYIEGIEKTEKKKVGKIDTIYFESTLLSVESMGNESLQFKMIGYSFMFNDQPICVYGELEAGDASTKNSLNDYLNYIISTIQPYEGESFVELEAMAMWNEVDYLNGSSSPLSNTDNFFDEPDFTIYHQDNHSQNGIFRLSGPLKSYWKEVEDRYNLSREDIKLEDIFDIVKATDNYDVVASSKEGFELFSEPQAITINNIAMMRYSGANKNTYPASSSDKTVYPYSQYCVVYTFQYEGRSYYFQYSTGLRMHELKEEEQWKLLQKLTDLNADTLIRTIMTKEQISHAKENFKNANKSKVE